MGNSKLALSLIIYFISISLLISYMATEMQISGVVDISGTFDDSHTTGIPLVDSAVWLSLFISNLSALVLWTLPEEIFPLWANLIFIKAPAIGLVLSVVTL